LSREESNAWVFGPEGKKVREKIDELQKAEAKQKRADTKRDHAGDAARSGLKSGDKVYQQGSNLFGIYRIGGTLVQKGGVTAVKLDKPRFEGGKLKEYETYTRAWKAA